MNGVERDKNGTPKKSGKEFEQTESGICENPREGQVSVTHSSDSSEKDCKISEEENLQVNTKKNEIRPRDKSEERQTLKLRFYRHKPKQEKESNFQQEKQKHQSNTEKRETTQEVMKPSENQTSWFIDNPAYGLTLDSGPPSPTRSLDESPTLAETKIGKKSPVHIYEEIEERWEENSYVEPENLNNISIEHQYESPNKLEQKAKGSRQHNYESENQEESVQELGLKITQTESEYSTESDKGQNANCEDLQNTLRRLDEIAEKTNNSKTETPQKGTKRGKNEKRELIEEKGETSENKTSYQKSINNNSQTGEEAALNDAGSIIIKIPVEAHIEKCVRHEICGNTANWACKKCKKMVCSKFCLYRTRCEPLSIEQIETGGLICSCGNTLHNVEMLEHALSQRVWVASIGSTNIYTTQTKQNEQEQSNRTQKDLRKDKKPKKINMLRANKTSDATFNINGTGPDSKPPENNVNNTDSSTEDELSKLLKEHIGETLPTHKVELGYPDDQYCRPQPIPREYGLGGEELNLVAYFEGKKILWPASSHEEDEFRQKVWKNQGPPKHQGWTWKWELENQEINSQMNYIFWEDALVDTRYPTTEGNWVHRQNQYFWHSTPVIRDVGTSFEANKKGRGTHKMPNSGPERYEGVTPRRDVPKLRERHWESFYNSKENNNYEISRTPDQKSECNEESTKKLEPKLNENLLKAADSCKIYQNRMKKIKRYRKDKQKYRSSTDVSEDEEIEDLLKSIRRQNISSKNRNIKTEPESDSDEDEEDDIPPNLTKALNRLKPFSGKLNDSKALTDFLNELQAIFSVYLPKDIQKNPQLADKIKAKALQVSLTENALGYFASLSPQDKKSYKKAKSLLKTRFTEPTTSIYIFQKLTELQQGGLTILALKEKIEDLVNRYIEEDQGLKNATTEVRNEVKKFLEIHNFRQALRKDIHDEIIKGNKIANQSFDSLVERALEIEGAQRIIRARDSFGKANRTQRLMNVQEEPARQDTLKTTPRSMAHRTNNSYLEGTSNRPIIRPQYMMNNFPKPGPVPPGFYSSGFPRITTDAHRFWNQSYDPNNFPSGRPPNFRPNRPEIRSTNAPWWRQNDHMRTQQQAWPLPNNRQHQNPSRYPTQQTTGQNGQHQPRWPKENPQEKTL